MTEGQAIARETAIRLREQATAALRQRIADMPTTAAVCAVLGVYAALQTEGVASDVAMQLAADTVVSMERGWSGLRR